MFEFENIVERNFDEKLVTNSTSIKNAIVSILGENISKAINLRIPYFRPIYFVTRDGLENTLSYDEIDANEERIIKYLLNKTDEKYYITSEFEDKDLQNTQKDFVIKFNWAYNVFLFYYKQEIFNINALMDSKYISYLLLSLSFKNKGKIFYFNINEIPTRLDKTIVSFGYSQILNYITLLIVKELRENDVYVFDSKNISLDINEYEESKPEYLRKMYSYFKDILYLLFVNPKEFVDIVGQENFEDFLECIFYEGYDEAISLLDNMLESKNSKSIVDVKFNMDLIAEGCRRYKKKKEKLD